MKKAQFSIRINASKQKVWDTMLDPETYKVWTTPFCEGSYFAGSWAQGERIQFLSPGGDGMSAIIEENRPYDFVSIKHIGMIKNGVEDTESDDVRKWAPAYEDYTFVSNDGGTEVKVELDVSAEWEDYMREKWPKALAILKSLSEAA